MNWLKVLRVIVSHRNTSLKSVLYWYFEFQTSKTGGILQFL